MFHERSGVAHMPRAHTPLQPGGSMRTLVWALTNREP